MEGHPNKGEVTVAVSKVKDCSRKEDFLLHQVKLFGVTVASSSARSAAPKQTGRVIGTSENHRKEQEKMEE